MYVPMAVFGIMLIIVLAISAWTAGKRSAGSVTPVSFITPASSKRYVAPPGWKGIPLNGKGSFMNYEYPFYRNYRALLKWIPGHARNLLRNRHIKFPVHYLRSSAGLEENDTIIWLGHASFFLRINNASILIDPHFYNTVMYKRHSDNPVPPALFQNIQYILLSHDHADHCDKRSLRLLIENNPQAIILGGLHMDKLVRSFTTQNVHTITADWYEEFALHNLIKIYFVPSRHYCARIGKKFNGRLWGGFVIKYKHSSGHIKTIYYGGDSGYGNHFKDIKELFKPDIAILPIGSYLPRWFMQPNHMSPEEALLAFEDCGARYMIPMHYGTFNLSNEDMDEPGRALTKHSASKNLLQLIAGEAFNPEKILAGKEIS